MRFLACALLLALALSAPAHTQVNAIRSANISSGTITAGNAFQQILAPNLGRAGCLIQDTSSHTMYVYLGAAASATTGASFQLASGQSMNCAVSGSVIANAISITTSTTGDTWVASEE